MRIVAKHNGDPIGTYRPIRDGEDPQKAMKRVARTDYPQGSARIEFRPDSAYAEWGEGFSTYSIVD